MNKKKLLLCISVLSITCIVIWLQWNSVLKYKWESHCASLAGNKCSGICFEHTIMGVMETDMGMVNYDGVECIPLNECPDRSLCGPYRLW